jgi:flavin reductase (DIM6/NTAB) family NADH-FMN oxidoreductase RutF
MSKFIESKPNEIEGNFFRMLKDEWALVTVQDPETGKVNTMTVSWGGVGVLWNKEVVTIYVRPQRYTHQFLDKTDCFTLSFYDGMKDALTICGRKSGRDTDKIAEAGLHLTGEENYPWFEESRLVLCCKALYRSTLEPAKMADGIEEKNYPAKDYHDVYIAEIVKVWQKQDA